MDGFGVYLEREPLGFADASDVGYDRKGVKNHTWATRRMKLPLTEIGKAWENHYYEQFFICQV